MTESYNVPGNCASSCSLSVCTQVGIPGRSGTSQGTEHKTGRPPVFPVAVRTRALPTSQGKSAFARCCALLDLTGYS